MKARGKKVDPAQMKARRQKKILIGACVLLFGLMAFQLPKLMKHNKPAEAAPPAATTTGTETPATPAAVTPAAPGTAQAASAPVAPAKLPNHSGPKAADGQLVSFSLFKSKDPFLQQLDPSGVPTGGSTSSSGAPTSSGPTASKPPAETPPSSTTPSATPSATPPSSTPPSETPPAETPPASEPPASTPPASEPPASTPPASTPPATQPEKPKAPTAALISVNGVTETVSIGGAFPKAAPLFRLVSIQDDVARIGIAGGTLQGKTQLVPLVKGKTLTLMNTADGMRYVLRLVSVS